MSDSREQQTPPEYTPPPIPEPKFVPSQVVARPKKSHGCLYGCLIATALILLIVGGITFSIYGFVKQARDMYTDTEPIALPVVEADPQTSEALTQRVEAFKESMDKGLQPLAPLVLSEKDINALIQYDPKWEVLADKVYILIEDDKIGGVVSIPLDVFGLPFFKGRYLNGSAEFSVFVRNDILHVYLRSLEVKGQSLPEEALQAIRAKNLAEQVQNDVEIRGILRSIENIEVKDGTLIITPKKKEGKERLDKEGDEAWQVT